MHAAPPPEPGPERPATESQERESKDERAYWEEHAQWWQDEFTDGADPEYVEQILPIVAETLGGATRVLEPGGTFLFLLNHPLLQVPGSGWIDDHILEEQYWRIGPYLVEDVSIEQIAPDVHLPFVHRPMSRYVNAMADHGLMLQRMLEPAPPPGFLAKAPEYVESASIPRLLVLNAQRR